MKINMPNRISMFMLTAIAICTGLYHIFGCAHIDRMTSVAIDSKSNHHFNAEAITLERGNQAFQNNDYKKALEIYRMLSQLAQNENIRRKSLYGLACTRLVLAKSPEELSESIVLWDVWSQLEFAETKDEYPILLRPLLLQKELPKKINTESKKPVKKPDVNVSLKKMVTARDKEILLLKNRIENMDKEIKKLKHQLSSLEAIDKNINQKMTEIE